MLPEACFPGPGIHPETASKECWKSITQAVAACPVGPGHEVMSLALLSHLNSCELPKKAWVTVPKAELLRTILNEEYDDSGSIPSALLKRCSTDEAWASGLHQITEEHAKLRKEVRPLVLYCRI